MAPLAPAGPVMPMCVSRPAPRFSIACCSRPHQLRVFHPLGHDSMAEISRSRRRLPDRQMRTMPVPKQSAQGCADIRRVSPARRRWAPALSAGGFTKQPGAARRNAGGHVGSDGGRRSSVPAWGVAAHYAGPASPPDEPGHRRPIIISRKAVPDWARRARHYRRDHDGGLTSPSAGSSSDAVNLPSTPSARQWGLPPGGVVDGTSARAGVVVMARK